MRSELLLGALSVLLLAGVGITDAAPIAVTNPSFESPVTSTYDSGVPTGWQDGGHQGVGVVHEFYTSRYIAADDGDQYAYLNSPGGLWQNLTHPIQPGTYTLTVSAADYGTYGSLVDAAATVVLYYGGSQAKVLASLTDTDVPSDSWETLTLVANVPVGHAAIGQNLGVYLCNLGAPSPVSQLWFDSVQVTYVPAPGALSLVILGIGALRLRRRW
ncbi:MAG: hypothetical protein JW955_15985 [Sedimentisphaerales bacterium]|nr:hypothetical protein [Sedimentisphaerales bacterium]